MKSILRILITLSLIINPLYLYASPMGDAENSVAASHQLAQSFAQGLVERDMFQALQNVVVELNKNEDVNKAFTDLQTSMADMNTSLSELMALDNLETSQSQSKVLNAYNKYKEVVRKRFDASFGVAQIKLDFHKTFRVIQKTLTQFEQNCQSGHSDKEFLYHPELFKNAPPLQTSFKVDFSSDGNVLLNSSSDGTGSQTEKTLNDLTQISGFVAGVTGSAWLGGKMGQGGGSASPGQANLSTLVVALAQTNPALYAAMQAAAPYAIVAFVIISAVTYLVSQDAKIKKAKELADSNDYILKNSATDKDVAMYYRSYCTTITETTQKMRTVLSQLESNPSTGDAIFIEANSHSQEIDSWFKIINRITELDSKKATTKTPLSGDDKKEYDDLMVKNKSIMTPNFITNYIVLVLKPKQESLNSHLLDLSWNTFDISLNDIFQKLLRIISLYESNMRMKVSPDDQELLKEVQITSDFETLKKEFHEQVALQIKLIFGSVSSMDVMTSAQSYFSKVSEFRKQYPYIQSVQDLYTSTNSLLKEIILTSEAQK